MKIKFNDFKTNKSLQNFTATIILCLIVIVGFGFSVKYNMEMQDKIVQQVEMVAQSQDRLTYLKLLAENEVEMQEIIEYYREKLPVGINQDTLLERIQDLSNKYNVTISQVTFGTVESVFNTNKLPMALSINGSYENVMRALEDLTVDGRIIIIEDIGFLLQQGNSVSISVAAGVYYQ